MFLFEVFFVEAYEILLDMLKKVKWLEKYYRKPTTLSKSKVIFLCSESA